MKSILQSIALVSAILFIVSCDSGGTSGVTNVPITPPQPPDLLLIQNSALMVARSKGSLAVPRLL